MSRRTISTVRQTPRILRFFAKPAAGVSFAYEWRRLLVAAFSCGLVGGCVVTSAEEFPEELQVPPVVLDTPGLPIGQIVAFNQKNENELRLGLTVRDANIDDVLQVHAKLTVVGQSAADSVYICPPIDIGASTHPDRDQFELLIERAKIRMGACNKLDVYVSREFVGTCTQDTEAFALPSTRGDIGHGLFWIWEVSGDPVTNPGAAADIVNSCPTVTRAGTSTSVPMVQ
jgi:hypothetical protein